MSPISAKTYTTEVICLRTIDFGEADKILQMYSPDGGRISVMAKGVKRSKSKLAGACELLSISEVQLSKGKNLDVLCQYQPRKMFVDVRSNLMKLAYGLLFAELIHLTSADYDMDSRQIYDLLKNALTALDDGTEAEAVPLGIEFQLALLNAAGYQPMLADCVLTGQPLDLSGVYYCFSAEMGGVTTPERKREHQIQTRGSDMSWVNVSASTLRLLGSPHEGQWSAMQLLKAQKFLQYYFKHVFDRSPHSYNLIFNLLETSEETTESAETAAQQQA